MYAELGVKEMAAHAAPQYVVDERGRTIAVIVPIEEYEALVKPRGCRGVRRRFRSADLVGKLGWSGDAVAAQRQLRNEW